MSKSLSDHAHAAKLIRAELKTHAIKGRVKASTSSMTSSVDVYLENCEPPWIFKAVETFANRFQYGHFDGMTDCYEYSNTNEGRPQVKFVFVHTGRSDADRKRAWDYLRKHFPDGAGGPFNPAEAGKSRSGDQRCYHAISP